MFSRLYTYTRQTQIQYLFVFRKEKSYMKPCNLLVHSSGAFALYKNGSDNIKAITNLKNNEIIVLKEMCDILCGAGCEVSVFEGYFVGYTIDQINKEFDLLRFGQDCILNIELKSELSGSKNENEKKVLDQLKKNYYYLNMVSPRMELITYVENEGFYKYSSENDSIGMISAHEVAEIMKNHICDETIDPSSIFVPSKYLISPFNTTERFIRGEYFLTQHQAEIKTIILNRGFQFEVYCLTANAGTGKTLLIYDIAKTMISLGKKVLIIHCANLNDGQRLLNHIYGWSIFPVKYVRGLSEGRLKAYDFVIVDEAQRIYESHLKSLLSLAEDLCIPILFSYDVKQFLLPAEKKDIFEYITINNTNIKIEKFKLTNKIRTNKAVASFIKNMFEIGSSNEEHTYDNITIEYINDMECLKEYTKNLVKKGWHPIKYTTSYYDEESLDRFANVSSIIPHNVIGQEYSKVVLFLDDSFIYDNNKLIAKNGYYDAVGMAYQIATRTVNDLKIVVFNNIALYETLCNIKYRV